MLYKLFLKKWANPSLFFVYFRSFQTNMITIFATNICKKMSIQYTVPGFKPTTFGKWVSSHNHLTRAPAQSCCVCDKSKINYAAHATFHVWLLGQTGCSSPSTTKELHGLWLKTHFVGRGSGQVVSVLAFYSVDPSSYPPEDYSFFCQICVWK